MTFGPLQVRPGMAVVDTAGQPVGEVKEVGLEDMLVTRPTEGEIHVPYVAIRAMLGDQIVLGDVAPSG